MASNKNRTLVKLDDKIIEITNGKKGLQARALTDAEVFETSVLDEGLEQFLENDMNRFANEAYEELKANFKNTLKANVLKVVGFENRWGGSGWEVDHCNGRQSLLTDYISSKVKKMFTDEFDKILQPEIEKALEPVKKSLIADFKSTFDREVHYKMREEANTAARVFVQEMLSTQIQKHQKKAIKQAEIAFLGREAGDNELDD
jgi:hypothetical protein